MDTADEACPVIPTGQVNPFEHPGEYRAQLLLTTPVLAAIVGVLAYTLGTLLR